MNQVCIKISGDNGKEIEGTFIFDLPEVQPASFWLLPIYTSSTAEGGAVNVYFTLLVLEVSNQQKGGIVFERVGIGHIEDACIVYNRSRQFVVLI